MKLRLFSSLLVVFMMFTLVSSAAAQEYSFQMLQETVQVYWNSDGTTAIDYTFVFNNDPGAHLIDFIDVGMPNGDFDWGSINADVNGQSVSVSSDYQGGGDFGFAVDLGAYAIQPGQQGTVHVYVGQITNMVYPDTSDSNYASSQFSPTWFDQAFVHGSVDLTVVFHLPPGVQPEQPRWHTPSNNWPCPNDPLTGFDEQNRITYTWRCPSANGYSQYMFGLSFPKQYIPAEAITQPVPFSLNINFEDFIVYGVFCCIGLVFIGIPILSVVNERRRKLKYLPPKISIEGHGIKRGLTAVEAAILLEQPLDKVMTMILFGAIKKEAAEVITRDPLELKVAAALPEGLHEYEKEFLKAFSDIGSAPRRKALQEMTVKLVQSVSDKMKGFSRKETAEYYKNIMERAWQQIETAGTPEVKSQVYDETLEWTMLDNDYDERTRRVFTGPVFIPMWWGRYDPTFRPSVPHMASTTPSTPSAGRPISVPGASLAASVVGSVQSFSSRVLGDVRSFTSGVTNRTNPAPKPSSSGGWRSSGGGGGCACACACAGCACACAGGGR